ncbi:MAG: undecaprenyl-diphosphate phosphatase [Bdellovibrionales bacterium]
MSLIEAILLAIVEGITEYLPISSTGHMIIVSSFLGIQDQPFTKDFTVIVQFGAIMSVLVLFWKRFLSSKDFYLRLIVGFLPAAVIGLLVKNKIDAILGSVEIVAWALMLGGIILIFSDRLKGDKKYSSMADIPLRTIFLIGLIQCFAFIPGVSRSAATILGGLYLGLHRTLAAELSFLLAVPTLAGATALKLLKIYPTIEASQIQNIAIGNLVSFIVGLLAIKGFIGFLSKRGLGFFGYYRIALGVVLLILIYSGFQLQHV